MANGVGRQSLSLPFLLSAKPRTFIVAECLISTASLPLCWLRCIGEGEVGAEMILKYMKVSFLFQTDLRCGPQEGAATSLLLGKEGIQAGSSSSMKLQA